MAIIVAFRRSGRLDAILPRHDAAALPQPPQTSSTPPRRNSTPQKNKQFGNPEFRIPPGDFKFRMSNFNFQTRNRQKWPKFVIPAPGCGIQRNPCRKKRVQQPLHNLNCQGQKIPRFQLRRRKFRADSIRPKDRTLLAGGRWNFEARN